MAKQVTKITASPKLPAPVIEHTDVDGKPKVTNNTRYGLVRVLPGQPCQGGVMVAGTFYPTSEPRIASRQDGFDAAVQNRTVFIDRAALGGEGLSVG